MEFMLQVLVSFCLITFTMESELIGSQRPIIAMAGDDVILPCQLEPPISAINETVLWTRPELNQTYIHYHQDGHVMIDHQNSDYNFRTRLFMDELTTGNVSMKISDVKLSDAGTYSCSLPSMQKEVSIQLVVNPQIICPSEPVEATVSQDVTLHCHLVPPLDATNMTVEWRNESQKHNVHLYQDGHASLFPEGLTEGNLSLKISSVQLFDSGRYRCSVTSENLQHSCYVNLTVVAAGNTNRTELIYNYNKTTDRIIIAIVVPFAIVILFVNILVIKKMLRKCKGDAVGDVAQGLNVCSSSLDFVNTVFEAV